MFPLSLRRFSGTNFSFPLKKAYSTNSTKVFQFQTSHWQITSHKFLFTLRSQLLKHFAPSFQLRSKTDLFQQRYFSNLSDSALKELQPQLNVSQQPAKVIIETEGHPLSKEEELYQEAVTLATVDKEWEKVLKVLDQVLEICPQHFNALHLKGVAQIFTRDFPAAVETFSRCLEIAAGSSEDLVLTTYFNRAMAYNRQNLLDKSLEDLKEVLKLDPANKQALYLKASIHSHQQEYPQALADFNKLINDYGHSTDPALFSCRSEVYLHLRDFDNCLKDAEYAIATDKFNYHAWFLRACVYLIRDDLREALSSSQIAVKMNPKDPAIYKVIATIYVKQKKFDEALKLFEKCLELSPNDEEALFSVNKCKEILGSKQQ